MTDHVPTANTDSIGIGEGSPAWVDLTVPDLDAVRPFYESLFGWDFEDYGEDFGHYHMITNGGAHVGGASAQTEDEAGQPAAWSVYLKSQDIDRSIADTTAAGGAVLVPAMAVGELGWMGMVTTPGGEALGVWQNNTFGGFMMTRRVGSPLWFDVLTFDFDADAEYYRTVWGWEPTLLGSAGPSGDTGQRYATDRPGDEATAGLSEADPARYPEGTPSFWRPYFIVEDADEAARTVTGLGGSVIEEPMDTPYGRLATVADPSGATFLVGQMTAQEQGRG